MKQAAPPTNPFDLMTPEELAAEVKVKPKTLANLRSRGEGPPYVRVHGAIRYPRAGVAAYLAERTVVPEGAA